MDLKQLQYFVACAQTRSFSDAAKVLYGFQRNDKMDSDIYESQFLVCQSVCGFL